MSLDGRKTGSPRVELKIAGGDDIGQHFRKIHWISLINNGYIIRGRVHDAYYNIARDIATRQSLSKGRKEPTEVKFRIQWADKEWTTERTAYLTNLRTHGMEGYGELEFIAVDPGSWLLSRGDAAGTIYTGKVSDVITQVVNKYAPKVSLKITNTEDDENNKWQMLRMDPKTFILSLLDWSSSVTPQKTAWVVASQDENIIIKELAELETKDFGQYVVNTTPEAVKEVMDIDMMADNFLTITQTRLTTQGISTITGKYLDKIETEDKVIVKDSNTSNKLNTNFGSDRGFNKPPDEDWATDVIAVPEHNAGDVGIKYEDYIDGRPRNQFIRLIPLVMRMKIPIAGDPKFDNINNLGAGKVTLLMNDVDGKPYFLSGEWIVYGFSHVVSPKEWDTELHVARLDYNAAARKI